VNTHSTALSRSFNQPIDSWNVSQVDNMNDMFLNARVFIQRLSTWAEKTSDYVDTIDISKTQIAQMV
jgi:hypothetical protein